MSDAIVVRAIRSGVLVRGPCSRCGAAKTHAHHEDYSKPLDVVWLCARCHIQRHKELKGFAPRELIKVRLDPDVKQALVRVAKIDGRSLSALIAKIASDWVKPYPAKPAQRSESRR
jgi:ribosomal protein S27AE